MRKPILIGSLAGIMSAGMLWLASHVLSQGTTVQKSPVEASPAAAQTAEAPIVLGHGGIGKWSATTIEAAATEENKKVLERGKPLSVTGEIVDVSCYLQLGKRGQSHVACGSKCLQHGQPIGI